MSSLFAYQVAEELPLPEEFGTYDELLQQWVADPTAKANAAIPEGPTWRRPTAWISHTIPIAPYSADEPIVDFDGGPDWQ